MGSATFTVEAIRNIALVGHNAAGKTMLGEAILHRCGVTKRFGKVDDGTSFLDYDEESKERKHSTDSVRFYVEQHNTVIPHSAFRGQTPDEMYFGTGAAVPDQLAEATMRSLPFDQPWRLHKLRFPAKDARQTRWQY